MILVHATHDSKVLTFERSTWPFRAKSSGKFAAKFSTYADGIGTVHVSSIHQEFDSGRPCNIATLLFILMCQTT